jgi:hypothetical protein
MILVNDRNPAVTEKALNFKAFLLLTVTNFSSKPNPKMDTNTGILSHTHIHIHTHTHSPKYPNSGVTPFPHN